MKRLILCSLFIPLAAKPGFNGFHSSSTNLVQIREGNWPIILERTIEKSDTSYSLQFRDEQVMTSIVMDTLPFPDVGQLKYFEKALKVLKIGNNGDIAKFKNYSVKRVDKKYEGTWYILRFQWASTEFRQTEADTIINTIKNLRF